LFQPAPLAVALVLLGGTVARAQATPREQRQRSITVTGHPAESPHEVRVAPDTPTVLLFGSEIRKKSVRVDATRIRVVDAGECSLILQAVSAWGDGERPELEVQFADGKAPERAVFVLPHRDSAHGFESLEGVAYRGKGWLLFQVRLRNLRAPQPWVPTEATLTGKAGEKLRGRVVLEEQGEPANAGLVFALELSGAEGRSLAIPDVKIPASPAPAKELKP